MATAGTRSISRGAFPLISLPFKLREAGYSAAFLGPQYTSLHDFSKHHECNSLVSVANAKPRQKPEDDYYTNRAPERKKPPPPQSSNFDRNLPLALLATCRQIDGEATKYLYHTIRLWQDPVRLVAMLHTLPQCKLALIRHVHTEYYRERKLPAGDLMIDTEDFHDLTEVLIGRHPEMPDLQYVAMVTPQWPDPTNWFIAWAWRLGQARDHRIKKFSRQWRALPEDWRGEPGVLWKKLVEFDEWMASTRSSYRDTDFEVEWLGGNRFRPIQVNRADENPVLKAEPEPQAVDQNGPQTADQDGSQTTNQEW